VRDFIAGGSWEVLKGNPVPDSFVGRKTEEPFRQKINGVCSAIRNHLLAPWTY